MVRRYKPINLPEDVIKEIDFHVNRSESKKTRAGLIKSILVDWIQTREKELFNKVFTNA